MNIPKKLRIDQLLVEKSFFPTRQKAQFAIRSGNVLVNNSIVDKPGAMVSMESNITIKEKLKYVSRGGLKLEAALNEFKINTTGVVALDIGCSTGGFTDCLLQHGVKIVYAIDVGYGQLDLSLRNNTNVILMEKTNARYLKKEDLSSIPNLVTIDVSFISLDKILPAVRDILSLGGEVVALIKPQFETEAKNLKKGVVKDPAVHEEVIQKIKKNAENCNFKPLGVIPSPILGPKGNKEFLLYMTKV